MQCKMIASIGNPGARHEGTYHNAGHLLFDHFAKSIEAPEMQERTLFSYAKRGEIILVRSHTFMNESGKAIRQALKTLAVPPKRLLLLHDDSDLALGTYRLHWNRGSAGHHGVESIQNALGTAAFFRLRIGVRTALPGTRASARKKAGDFVLRRLTVRDEETLYRIFDTAARSIVQWIENKTPPLS